jgi:hypothetical protein
MATNRASRGRARAITAKQYRREPRVIDPLSVTADHTGVPSGDNITYTLHFAAASASTTVDVDSPSTPQRGLRGGRPDPTSGNHLSWHLAGSGLGTKLKLVVGTASVTQTQNVGLTFAYRQGQSAVANASAAAVLVEGYPVARIEGLAAASLNAKAGDNLSLDTHGSTGALEGDTLQFNWRQTAGPQAPVIATGGAYALNVPPEVAGKTLRYELVVSNGRRNCAPATLEIDVAAASSGGGGAVGWPLLIMLAMAVMRRPGIKVARK